jgi:hypothetical protein
MITIEQLVAEVTRLAQENPENSYEQTAIACYYNKGTCTNGTVGCIFGQAFRNLEQPLEDIFDSHCGNTGIRIGIVLKELKLNNIPELVNWCSEFQYWQDRHCSWNQCLVNANKSIQNEDNHVNN